MSLTISENGLTRAATAAEEAEIRAFQAADAAARDAFVPLSVPMPKARIALRRAGRIDEVDALVASIGGETSDWWHYSTDVERAHPLFAQLAGAMGPPLSDAEVDDLFRATKTIV